MRARIGFDRRGHFPGLTEIRDCVFHFTRKRGAVGESQFSSETGGTQIIRELGCHISKRLLARKSIRHSINASRKIGI